MDLIVIFSTRIILHFLDHTYVLELIEIFLEIDIFHASKKITYQLLNVPLDKLYQSID